MDSFRYINKSDISVNYFLSESSLFIFQKIQEIRNSKSRRKEKITKKSNISSSGPGFICSFLIHFLFFFSTFSLNQNGHLTALIAAILCI